ncbi:NAD(P)-dependent dehydrogenase (short-subunit alcohol dehydrogenase family) [Nocardioides sp. J9]|uniref:SDR family oxidoreductase n=1 Tax=Nocardioides sp. J9 TaxID=935844 RepID=UPI0011A98E2C|nr:SDR family oxidoreductase [Nocardioides sp. J9]TWH01750.1 NAD(P)-dependent dehydrogenase (short-subunit alcohol dehydrogenase family) [Nocardioides sp. J9]
MDLGLSEKRVLITAGASGIGWAIARQFVAEGAQVLVCDIDAEAIARIDPGTGVMAIRADVSNSESVDYMFQEVQRRLGGLDVLVNNAGTSGPARPVESVSDDEWRATIGVNLDGAFYCARSAVPLLKEAGGGTVINLSSVAGLFPFAWRSPYSTAKYGVIGLTEVLARELGKHNINVNAICPGNVDSPRMERVFAMNAQSRGISVEEISAAVRNQNSMQRWVSVDEVASVIAYLCSPQARIISGQSIAVDGHTIATEY